MHRPTRALLATLGAAALAACADANPGSTAPAAPDLSAVPGSTPTEQLLHLLGMPETARQAMLAGLDRRVAAMEASGDAEQVEQAARISETRPFILQAANENMDTYIAQVAAIYDANFTEAEIQRLLVLHADPAMQAFQERRPVVNAEVAAISSEYASLVGNRYADLVAKRNLDKVFK